MWRESRMGKILEVLEMSKVYRSKFEAYPFLCDGLDDLRCDFELLTDEVSSMTGHLAAVVSDQMLKGELLFVCELVYHINPSLRTKTTVTKDELDKLERIVNRLHGEVDERCNLFVLPRGSETGSLAHILRVKCKSLVRLLYRHLHQDHQVDEILFDFTNLLSGYFFLLALKLNALEGVDEVAYVSRNYK